MHRLSRAGFKKDFVGPAILPDWWDQTCEEDHALLTDIEFRVARFLRLPVSAVRDAASALAPPAYPEAQLRRVRDLDRDRLAPAIHAAMQVASAVVRSLKTGVPAVATPPTDGLVWRDQLRRSGGAIKFEDVLDDLWKRGIPVVSLDLLPTPSFQGLACIVEDRPVVVLGYKHDEPGRVAFFIAHEVGHIAAGDCTANHPVVDEDEEVADDTDIERRADRYATRVLVGEGAVPEIEADNYRDLATKAAEIGRSTQVDAGAIIFAWARRTSDYAKASMAVKALYRASGARRLLRKHFECNVDLDSATESDRALLHCVFRDPVRDAAAP